MKKKNFATWAAAATLVVGSLTACGLDMPKETNSSFETMIVKKSDINQTLNCLISSVRR